MYACVCAFACACVCVCVFVCVWAFMCACFVGGVSGCGCVSMVGLFACCVLVCCCLSVSMPMCVLALPCVLVFVCVRVCVRARVCANVHACVSVCLIVCACVYMCVNRSTRGRWQQMERAIQWQVLLLVIRTCHSYLSFVLVIRTCHSSTKESFKSLLIIMSKESNTCFVCKRAHAETPYLYAATCVSVSVSVSKYILYIILPIYNGFLIVDLKQIVLRNLIARFIYFFLNYKTYFLKKIFANCVKCVYES